MKTASNHTLRSANGNPCPSHKQKKAGESMHNSASGWNWKISLVFLCLVIVFFGLIWFLTSLSDRKSGRNVEILISSGSCHGSKEKLASLTHGLELECRKASSCIEACAAKMLGSNNYLFGKECELVTYNVGPNAGCSSSENNEANCLGATMPSDLCCKEHKQNICRNTFSWLAKTCLWILAGMAISHNFTWLHDQFWRQKPAVIQKQPLLQQPQLQHQTQFPTRNTGKWRKKLLVAFVLGGIITSVWLFWYLNEDIVFRRKETLTSMCDEHARMLQDQFNVSMNHVHALAILVSTFHHGKHPSAIDQETFEDYTETTAFERPLTSGVAYALRVRHSERENIERQYGWTIKKMEMEDQTLAQDNNPETFSASPVQDEYAPVIFSQKTVSHIVSIDMMSGKEDRENIIRARGSGKGVLTSPFKLLKSNHLGVVLTFAVYDTHLPPDAIPELRINATVGYLGASYDVPSLVEKLHHQLASKETMIVNVYDTTSKFSPIKMYGSDVVDTGLLHVSHLDFGDPTRKHEMHCRFKQKPSPPWQAITASIGVLVITLLLGHIFHAAINRIAKVEHDFQEMMELKHRAEAADVAKSQFLATVSHEIRTPMNGVLGMLEMLMDANLDVSQLDYAQTAHASGKDLILLISKVLDQAKIESGRLELEAVPFNIRAVLDKILSSFSGKSQERGIELAVYVSKQVPEVVTGDQERFGQIITNLVGNSIKFTHFKGHIFVSVHLVDEVTNPHDLKDDTLSLGLNIVQDSSAATHDTLSGFQVVNRWKSWECFKNLDSPVEEEPGKIRLLVTVEDTGAGIPPEAHGRIFTPFMQADSSTSRRYGGTGIGLSISKRLVNLMGGEIGFASELNVGSTFSFTLNFTKEEANSLDSRWRLCDQPASEFRGLRALVIDDRRIRVEVTRYHLHRLGISVVVDSSMESLRSYISCNIKTSVPESERFAMVLIDQEIWEKEVSSASCNLIETIRQRGLGNKSGIPPKIFLLSTCKSSPEQDSLKLNGLVDGFITKPLRLSALASTFQGTLGKRLDRKSKQSTLSSLLKGKRILVVDDNFVNRRVAEAGLKKHGAAVVCAEGGEFAVESLKPPHTFDACFMDLQMPEMDGFEATQRIRVFEREYNEGLGSNGMTAEMPGSFSRWHTPILAMTADASQETNEKCIKCGMDYYVSKPFGEGELYSAMAHFFDSEPLRDE